MSVEAVILARKQAHVGEAHRYLRERRANWEQDRDVEVKLETDRYPLRLDLVPVVTHPVHADNGYQDADGDVEQCTGKQDVVLDAEILEAECSSLDAAPEEERKDDACGDYNAEEAFL